MGVAVPLAAACTGAQDSRAEFVRYGTDAGGGRVALVRFVGNSEPDVAACGIDGLRAGDTVIVRFTGRGWGDPQWTPERAVVGRAD
jgi:hypothetical protein